MEQYLKASQKGQLLRSKYPLKNQNNRVLVRFQEQYKLEYHSIHALYHLDLRAYSHQNLRFLLYLFHLKECYPILYLCVKFFFYEYTIDLQEFTWKVLLLLVHLIFYVYEHSLEDHLQHKVPWQGSYVFLFQKFHIAIQHFYALALIEYWPHV